jgi:hypothetical protein
MVMVPATLSHWGSGRLRFSIDLLFMPVVATLPSRLTARVVSRLRRQSPDR